MVNTLNVKKKKKNKLYLLGIQMPFLRNLRFVILKQKSNTKTKIKICGKKQGFTFQLIKFLQLAYFLKFNILEVKKLFETKNSNMWQNIYNILLTNFLRDINYSFKVYLRIYGIAYKVLFENNHNTLALQLGFTHKIKKNIPKKLFIKTFDRKSRKFFIKGMNRQFITEFAMSLILSKQSNIYTGKGLKMYNRKLRKKSGKKKFA